MFDWNKQRKAVSAGVAEIAKISPDIVRGYQTLSGSASKTARLGQKVNELIALAVAVTLRCEGCIAVHTAAAVRAGATREEVVEALGAAASVNAGAVLVYTGRVLDAFSAETPHASGVSQ